jgi:Domain of unknown function (DUF5666)
MTGAGWYGPCAVCDTLNDSRRASLCRDEEGVALLKEPSMAGHHANRLLMFFAASAVAAAATGCSDKNTSTTLTSPSTSSAAVASPTPDTQANPRPGNGQPNAAELEGRINAGSLAGSCAAHNLSFTVGTTKVVTNASTQFKDARCDALQGNSEVEVKGTRQSDRSILAASVEGDDDHEDENENENEDRNEVELKGAIAAGSIGGSCAASNLLFRVSSTLVKTNASTQFKDTPCASLKTGDSVEVKGRGRPITACSRPESSENSNSGRLLAKRRYT